MSFRCLCDSSAEESFERSPHTRILSALGVLDARLVHQFRIPLTQYRRWYCRSWDLVESYCHFLSLLVRATYTQTGSSSKAAFIPKTKVGISKEEGQNAGNIAIFPTKSFK